MAVCFFLRKKRGGRIPPAPSEEKNDGKSISNGLVPLKPVKIDHSTVHSSHVRPMAAAPAAAQSHAGA